MLLRLPAGATLVRRAVLLVRRRRLLLLLLGGHRGGRLVKGRSLGGGVALVPSLQRGQRIGIMISGGNPQAR